MVCLVLPLDDIVEEEKDGREPDHPLDGEVEGPHLAAINPGEETLPRRLLGFPTSLGQDVSNPEN